VSPLEAILDELAAAAVHAGFPAERSKLAGSLLGDGMHAEDVALLAAHCAATVDGEAAAARVLVSLLVDPKKREARLADLRTVAAAKARRIDKAFGDAKATPRPIEGSDDRAAWIAAGLWREIAWRVHDEGARVLEIAAVLGRDPAETRDLIRLGEAKRAEQKPPERAPVKDEPELPDHEKRKRFREWLRGQEKSK
jgi:hypothetical protein